MLETVPEEEDGDFQVGPQMPKAKKRKILHFEAAHLNSLPSAQMYEKSYMHRDTVTHVEVAQEAEFIITGSSDGHIKFWKKRQKGVEFAKHFRAHLGAIAGLAVSHDSSLLASISTDEAVKVFDVRTLDMMAMLRLPFTPGCIEWIFKPGDSRTKLAVADRDSADIHVFDVRGESNKALETFKVGHSLPVTHMKYSASLNCVISTDNKGHIEYWRVADHQFPEEAVNFKYKMETDLFALAKAKTTAGSLAVSADGSQFAMFCADRKVRVFWFARGKLRRVYDETIDAAQELQRGDASLFKLEAIDFGRRISIEKEIEGSEAALLPNAVFDESGNFVLYATLLGIKVVNMVTNRVARIIGKVENTERFIRIALFQGSVIKRAGAIARLPGGADGKHAEGDPMVVATAFQRQRFYLFSKREPEDTEEAAQGRDVFNEKPTTELLQTEDAEEDNPEALPRGAIIHTSRGDISVKLFHNECPRSVENFTTHSREGYYSGVIFHRVIKGFCIQTGDPLGDGTGGTSIWGTEFADEIHKHLRHDRAFTLSMANAGPNTNGSQFFITTVPTPWLDGKHTVFGRVVKGADVVQNIEKAKTNKDDLPFEKISILNIEVKGSVE